MTGRSPSCWTAKRISDCIREEKMKIEKIVVGPVSTNCYILQKDGTQPVLVIDPGAEAGRIMRAVGDREVAAVLLTHGHFDHTAALYAFADRPIYLHEADVPMLSDPEKNVGAQLGDLSPRPAATNIIKEGDTFTLAGLEISVMHTPGHTPGSVCYRIGDVLFTGDTLFHRGYGRTDHWGGDMHTEMQSLRRLIRMEEDLPFYPGHGIGATLAEERQ
ncbi:MAG: MBL fold metallo-hydrolase [Clostridiales bacterium]|nr:MBL fold metallo-hydrolase [Clostridiales bacterium]